MRLFADGVGLSNEIAERLVGVRRLSQAEVKPVPQAAERLDASQAGVLGAPLQPQPGVQPIAADDRPAKRTRAWMTIRVFCA